MVNVHQKRVLNTQSDSLRIGLFSESFHPVQNGVTTSVLTLVAGLRQRGHRAWVFAPANQEQREPENNVLRFPSFVSTFNEGYPLAFPFLPRLALTTRFQRLRLNIVHTHTPFVLGLTGANLAIRRNIPLVSTFHTLYSQYSHYVPLLPDTVTQSLLEHYLPWYYNRCTVIICPSQVARKALQEQGVERPIEIIPTGVPLPPPDAVGPEARQRTREQLGIAQDARVLLYAGRIAREKNLDWLIDVFVQIRCRVPAVRLMVAGGGPYLEELQTRARTLDLGESVLFLGPMPRRQMDALYAAADVFTFPSPSETQGLVIGEARAAGTPCVVIDEGGAPETVRDNIDGFRIRPDDKTGFADRVVQLLEDHALRAEMRENALRGAQDLTPDKMVQRVLDVYEFALQQAPAPGSLTTHALAPDIDWEAVGQSVRENRGHRTG